MATTEPCKTYSSRVLGYGIDYGMPDLDGISAAQEILSIRPRPIVLLTDDTEAEVVERFARAVSANSRSSKIAGIGSIWRPDGPSDRQSSREIPDAQVAAPDRGVGRIHSLDELAGEGLMQLDHRVARGIPVDAGLDQEPPTTLR